MDEISLSALLSLLKKPVLPLVQLEAHESVARCLQLMKTQCVTAVVVVGKQDHWIGAGASVMLEEDTGLMLVGIVTIMDVIVFLSREHAHAAKSGGLFSVAQAVQRTRVVDIVGQNAESLSLWVANAAQPLRLALEPLGKGVHRFLLPAAADATLARPNRFHMCTQSDVVAAFARLVAAQPARFAALACAPISRFASPRPVTVSMDAPAFAALETIANMNILAVPVVDSGGVLADTLSASDFRAVVTNVSFSNASETRNQQTSENDTIEMIVQALASGMCVRDFLGVISGVERGASSRRVLKGVVSGETPFADAVARVVESRIHRLWIVDGFGVPTGVLSLGDMIRGICEYL